MSPTAVFNVLASAAFAISTPSSAIASTRFATAIADEPPITETSSISSRPDGRWVAEVQVEPFPRPVMIQLVVDGSTEPSSITASIPVLGMFSGTPNRRTVEDGVVRLDFASVGVTCQMDLRAAASAGIAGVLRFTGEASTMRSSCGRCPISSRSRKSSDTTRCFSFLEAHVSHSPSCWGRWMERSPRRWTFPPRA
ncbi:MAG: hypothetical protein ACYTDE_07270 [Planctomycetota bacterium]|jgi:hypothetical protein